MESVGLVSGVDYTRNFRKFIAWYDRFLKKFIVFVPKRADNIVVRIYDENLKTTMAVPDTKIPANLFVGEKNYVKGMLFIFNRFNPSILNANKHRIYLEVFYRNRSSKEDLLGKVWLVNRGGNIVTPNDPKYAYYDIAGQFKARIHNFVASGSNCLRVELIDIPFTIVSPLYTWNIIPTINSPDTFDIRTYVRCAEEPKHLSKYKTALIIPAKSFGDIEPAVVFVSYKARFKPKCSSTVGYYLVTKPPYCKMERLISCYGYGGCPEMFGATTNADILAKGMQRHKFAYVFYDLKSNFLKVKIPVRLFGADFDKECAKNTKIAYIATGIDKKRYTGYCPYKGIINGLHVWECSLNFIPKSIVVTYTINNVGDKCPYIRGTLVYVDFLKEKYKYLSINKSKEIGAKFFYSYPPTTKPLTKDEIDPTMKDLYEHETNQSQSERSKIENKIYEIKNKLHLIDEDEVNPIMKRIHEIQTNRPKKMSKRDKFLLYKFFQKEASHNQSSGTKTTKVIEPTTKSTSISNESHKTEQRVSITSAHSEHIEEHKGKSSSEHKSTMSKTEVSHVVDDLLKDKKALLLAGSILAFFFLMKNNE